MRTAETIEAQAAQDKTAKASRSNTRKCQDGRSRNGDASRIAAWKWKKGFCPNPTGRPKNDRAQEIAREVFERNPEAVYQAMGKAVLGGNAYAFGQLADRAYGKIPQKQIVTGVDDGPVNMSIQVSFVTPDGTSKS